jgi:hypothetical protein
VRLGAKIEQGGIGIDRPIGQQQVITGLAAICRKRAISRSASRGCHVSFFDGMFCSQ